MGQRERVNVIMEYLTVKGIWIELASGTEIEKNGEAQAAVSTQTPHGRIISLRRVCTAVGWTTILCLLYSPPNE